MWWRPNEPDVAAEPVLRSLSEAALQKLERRLVLGDAVVGTLIAERKWGGAASGHGEARTGGRGGWTRVRASRLRLARQTPRLGAVAPPLQRYSCSGGVRRPEPLLRLRSFHLRAASSVRGKHQHPLPSVLAGRAAAVAAMEDSGLPGAEALQTHNAARVKALLVTAATEATAAPGGRGAPRDDAR